MPRTTITAEYIRHRYVKDEDADQSWGIWILYNDELGDIVALGDLPKHCRGTGCVLSLFGSWQNDPKWGEQFKFQNAVPQRPKGKFATIRFLQAAPGIGPVTARGIWNHFEEKSIEVLAHDPDAIREKVRRLNNTDLTEASVAMQNIIEEADRKGPLVSLFEGISFPKRLVDDVLRVMGGDPVAAIRSNPFVLLRFPRVGFLLCDELRHRLELPADMPERKQAAALHVLKQNSNQVWVNKLQAYTSLKDLIGGNNAGAAEVFRYMYTNGHIAYHDEHFALAETYEQEQEVARHLVRLSNGGSMMDWQINDIRLTNHQAEQLHAAKANGGVLYLLGGAGTGKTFSLSAILENFDDRDIVACAPTGKAAQRMYQTLVGHGIHVQPRTIHSTLEAMPDFNGNWQFVIDGIDNFLECKLLVVDEVSMLDNRLACCLFRAVRSGTLVALIGDPHQLSPVGRGTMLRDWPMWCDEHKNLGSYGLLSEIHRNQGKIIETCGEIYKGRTPQIEFKKGQIVSQWTKDYNLHGMLCDDEDEIALAAEHVALRAVRGSRPYGNPLTDLQFVVATNSGSPASKQEMNELIRKVYAGADLVKYVEKSHFWKGDRVIGTSNGRHESITGRQIYAANGGFGIVTEVSGGKYLITMDDYPDHPFEITKGDAREKFELGYAVTCHRMQGSQAKVVFTVASNTFKSSMVCDRSWLYTALTRATDFQIVAGNQAAIDEMCSRTKIMDRISYIPQWLTEECNGKRTDCLFLCGD